MPAFYQQIYKNIPVYARIVDESQRQLLKHVCNAVQPQIDVLFQGLQKRNYLYNSDITPEEWLEFIGQFVGLGARANQYLGFGINSSSTPQLKRQLVKAAWKHWQSKGTEKGIKQAIALWLDVQPTLNNFDLILPFSKTPTYEPHSWWTWETVYGDNLCRKHTERRQLGAASWEFDHPNYFTLSQDRWLWEWGEVWTNGAIAASRSPELCEVQTHFGPLNTWFNFYLKETDWVKIFPDFYQLLPEIIPASAIPTIFAWVIPTLPTAPILLTKLPQPPLQQTALDLVVDGFQWGVLDIPAITDKTVGGTMFPWDETTLPDQVVHQINKYFFGVWEPYYWLWQEWGTGRDGRSHPTQETLLIVTTTPISTLKIDVELEINIAELSVPAWSFAELFYAPYQEYSQEIIKIIHPTSESIDGVPIALDSNQNTLEISLGDFNYFPDGLIEPEQSSLFFDDVLIFNNNVQVNNLNLTNTYFKNVVFSQQSIDSINNFRYIESSNWFAINSNLTINSSLSISTEGIGDLIIDITDIVIIDDAFIIKDLEDTLFFDETVYPHVWAIAFPYFTFYLLDSPIKIATFFDTWGDTLHYEVLGNQGEVLDFNPIAIPIKTLSIDETLTGQTLPLPTPQILLENVFARWSTRTVEQLTEVVSVTAPLVDVFPLVQKALLAKNWKVIVETTEELYILEPLTIYWHKISDELVRSQTFSFDDQLTVLYLEFLFRAKATTFINSCSLFLGDLLVQYQEFGDQLHCADTLYTGFQFHVPFQLASGFDTSEEEDLIDNLMPQLQNQYQQILGAIARLKNYDNH